MKRVIIFGATGTLGVYTSLRFKELDYNVIAVGRRKSDNGFFADHNIPYYSVDISKKEEFDKLPTEDVECVIHYAGAMPAHMKGYRPHEYIDSIITGTLNVLEYTKKVHGKKIVFTQSISDCFWMVHDATPVPADIWRKFPLNNDHSIYVIAKNAAVDLIEHYYEAFGIKRFILRLPTIYLYHPDPFYHVNGEKREMFYRMFIDKAISGEPIEIWGDASKVKEIVYVKDFVQIVEKCVESPLDGGFYNVGEEECVSLEEQVRGIIDVFGKEGHKSPVIYRSEMQDPSEFVFDISKTKNELGYKPKFNYRKSLTDFKQEMETNPFEKLWGKESDYR
ncbi:Putative UDP-glucose 4-epimerase [Bacteroidales bacterium CF]|jgi:Nucleoside-diphosphate-sugar epimerases|nr:Putative UDP-glucose 4-epimerase [Bacteroidales bacterium CF]